MGAVLMNCNQFTLGHRYLIEQASKIVDHLYVFVVEEDKSFFPFSDKIRLVKEGNADLKNIRVIPIGKYMIWLLTFPGYFVKDDKTDKISIDCSKEITIFGK